MENDLIGLVVRVNLALAAGVAARGDERVLPLLGPQRRGRGRRRRGWGEAVRGRLRRAHRRQDIRRTPARRLRRDTERGDAARDDQGDDGKTARADGLHSPSPIWM